MDILEVIVTAIIFGFAGYLISLFFHQNLKSWLYFRYMKSPLELSSSLFDAVGYEYRFMKVGKKFTDTLIITNNSDIPIRIKKMEADIKLLDGRPSQSGFTRFWFGKQEQLERSMGTGNPVQKSRLLSMGDGDLFPKVLKPQEHTKIFFGISAFSELDRVRTIVSIYPVYDYKKPKISYFLAFTKKNSDTVESI